MSWKKSMGPIREVTAGREAGVGVSGSWRWQTREWPVSELGPASPEAAQCVQLKDAQPGGHAWALASPRHATRVYGAETDQGAIPAWQLTGCQGFAPAPTGAAGGREPRASAGRGSPSPPSPRFRQRLGGGCDRGLCLELPPPPPAPLRAHSQAAGVASTRPQGFGVWRETLSERDAGRGWLVLRFASARDGPLGTCGLRGAGTPRGRGRWLPPRRAGRENPASASGASFLSLTRGDTGGPDPQRGGVDPGGDPLDPGSAAPPAGWGRQDWHCERVVRLLRCLPEDPLPRASSRLNKV